MIEHSQRTLLFLFLLAVVLISGCSSVGPDFEVPESDVSDGWLEMFDERVIVAEGDYSQWWESFNDPILISLIEQAHENNKTLEIAGLRVLEGRALLGIATGSRYPQVQQIGGSVGRVELSENADPISNLPDGIQQNVDTGFGNYRLGFDAAWEADFWGRFSRTVESADANMAATIATYDDVLVTLTGEVAAAYMLLRTLEERLAVAESNVAIQQRSFEISETRNRNQLTTEFDPQVARAFLRITEATIPQLKISIRRVRNALCLLLGKTPGALDEELDAGSGIPIVPTEVVTGIPADLLRRRPDIRRAELRAASQSARIGIARAEMYPAFSLLGNIGFASANGSDLFDSDSLRGFGLVNFRWNILNYGRIKNLVRVEDAKFQQLIVNYENTVLNAAREVEDATIGFILTQQQIAILQDGEQAAQRALDLSLIQYREGTADYTRVLDSQRILLLQQDQLTRSRGRVAENLVRLYKTLGGGWEQRDLANLVSDDTREIMRERTNWGKLLEPESVEPVSAEDRGKWRLPDR